MNKSSLDREQERERPKSMLRTLADSRESFDLVTKQSHPAGFFFYSNWYHSVFIEIKLFIYLVHLLEKLVYLVAWFQEEKNHLFIVVRWLDFGFDAIHLSYSRC